MKIAVLGGTGFLGAHVVRAFQTAGHEVISASRSSGVDAHIESSLSAFFKTAKADIFINCAANGGGIAYNAQYPTAIFEDNLLIGFHCIRAAARFGIRKYIGICGNSTYPAVLDVHAEADWWSGPMHPSVLASAFPKKAQWVHAWAYQQEQNFRSIHLVLPNMYGPGDHLDLSRSHALMALVWKIWNAKQSGAAEVQIWGTGTPVREWLYVEDAAQGILRAVERYDDLEVLNLGSGEGCSIRQLAGIIADVIDWRGAFVCDATRPDGAARKVSDNRKMRTALGWTPPTSLRTGIEKTVEWFASVQRSPSLEPAVHGQA